MCQQIESTHNNNNKNNRVLNVKEKPNYIIKRVLKIFFKKNHKQHNGQHQEISAMAETFESFDNLRNSQMEEQYYEEIGENSVNEKLAQIVEDHDVYVPVRFARTTAGTFFWTTNLQPVASTITPTIDEDLVQPAYCYSSCPYPGMQFQDRWAQA